MGDAYLCGMFTRVVSMLAILAIAVVTTVTSAHVARMSAGPAHASHVSKTMHGSHDGELSCADQHHCGAADAEMCDFVCAGLSAFLASTGGEVGREYRPAGHDLPTGADYASRTPGLNERPPKLRLL